MTPAARERLQIRAPILLVSAAAWTLLTVGRGGTRLAAHCSTRMLGVTGSPGLLDTLMGFNSPGSLLVGWALMLTAMMGPLLIPPLRHVHQRSFARSRARATVLFVAGYATIWMATSGVFVMLALAVPLIVRDSWFVALVILGALLWQFSPAKQGCLNRGHAHPELAAFGRAANMDAFRFGVTHGVWCVGSCWALMLLPFLFPRGHVAAMAAVTLWLFCERIERPMPPRWELRSPVRAARIVAAQMRTWLLVLNRGCYPSP